MKTLEDLKRDLEEILGSGIRNTNKVIEMLQARGWADGQILPIVYNLLLHGKLDPAGPTTPFRTN